MQICVEVYTQWCLSQDQDLGLGLFQDLCQGQEAGPNLAPAPEAQYKNGEDHQVDPYPGLDLDQGADQDLTEEEAVQDRQEGVELAQDLEAEGEVDLLYLPEKGMLVAERTHQLESV